MNRNMTGETIEEAFRSGMTPADVIASASRPVVLSAVMRHLERERERGRMIKIGDGRGARYFSVDNKSTSLPPMRPLRQAFTRSVIPVRAGGVVMSVNWTGSHYEVVGDRGRPK